MPYFMEYIAHQFGLIVTWTGAVNGDEVIHAYHERFAPPQRLATLRYILDEPVK
jgi:hypothetical protein